MPQGIAPIAASWRRSTPSPIWTSSTPSSAKAFLTSFVYGFYGIRASPDLADSSTYAAWYTGPPLGLPNRDYYWDGRSNEAIREAYRAMIAELLGYGGYAAEEAEDAAERIYEL